MKYLMLCFFIFCKTNNLIAFIIQTQSFAYCNAACNLNLRLNDQFLRKYLIKIPKIFTCDGQDISPQLSWRDIQKNTKSFVLIVDDPDAQHVVGKTFIHWFVINIPKEINDLPINVNLEESKYKNVLQLKNDFGNSKYNGPCPPKGDFPHIYRFSLFALNVKQIQLRQALSAEQFQDLFKSNILNCSRLLGVYQRN